MKECDMALFMQILQWLMGLCALAFAVLWFSDLKGKRGTRGLAVTVLIGLILVTVYLIGSRFADTYADCSAIAWFSGLAAFGVFLMLRFLPEVFLPRKRPGVRPIDIDPGK